MDRRQDKHYEEEQFVEQNSGINNAEPVDDMRYFIGLIMVMRDMIENSKGIGRWRMIDADKLESILEDLDNNLPTAVQVGMQMYSERDRIISNSETEARDRVTTAEMRAKAMVEAAQNDADRIMNDAQEEVNSILQDAQERADFMVSESEILRRAIEEAGTIKSDATIEANELKLKVIHDGMQMMLRVENELKAALDGVVQTRSGLSAAAPEQ